MTNELITLSILAYKNRLIQKLERRSLTGRSVSCMRVKYSGNISRMNICSCLFAV